MSAATCHEYSPVPPAPPGLSAPAPSGGTVMLTWKAPPRSMTHDVRRASHSDPLRVFSVLATGLAGTSYSDTPGSGTWDYQVRAVNAKGNGPWTQSLTVTV